MNNKFCYLLKINRFKKFSLLLPECELWNQNRKWIKREITLLAWFCENQYWIRLVLWFVSFLALLAGKGLFLLVWVIPTASFHGLIPSLQHVWESPASAGGDTHRVLPKSCLLGGEAGVQRRLRTAEWSQYSVNWLNKNDIKYYQRRKWKSVM